VRPCLKKRKKVTLRFNIGPFLLPENQKADWFIKFSSGTLSKTLAKIVLQPSPLLWLFKCSSTPSKCFAIIFLMSSWQCWDIPQTRGEDRVLGHPAHGYDFNEVWQAQTRFANTLSVACCQLCILQHGPQICSDLHCPWTLLRNKIAKSSGERRREGCW
jgi:hypothetical protein